MVLSVLPLLMGGFFILYAVAALVEILVIVRRISGCSSTDARGIVDYVDFIVLYIIILLEKLWTRKFS